MDKLYVVKLGSSTILKQPNIFSEIHNIVQRGNKVLLVAGGAEGIKQKYEHLGREMPFLTLLSGDEVRYCSPEEMPIIRAAYHEIIIAKTVEAMKKYNLRVFAQLGGDNGVVIGRKAKPLKAIKDGRAFIVRDSLFGSYTRSHKEFLKSVFTAYDVVCVTPPIFDPEIGEYINIDADMLASHLAIDLDAHHLRFVTGTPGILQDIHDDQSTIREVYQGDKLPSITGRMKQKVRAAHMAIEQGVCDVNISGPHTFMGSGITRFWNFPKDEDRPDFDLLNKVIRIPSVSKDEHELAEYLLDTIRYPSVSGRIDDAGNIVFQKGNGSKRLLLLGHIDTVPPIWKVKTDQEGISGRGVVDAKGSFVNFVHMLEEVEVPENGTLLVIGAVEEEVSSSKGAYYVRDHYPSDAVIIGEPSGEDNLTLGYYGLYKLRITISKPQEHTAAKDSISVIDELYQVVEKIRQRVREIDPNTLSSLIDIKHFQQEDLLTVVGTLNFRISPAAGKEYSSTIPLDHLGENVAVEVLRATPGFSNRRNDPLVKAFVRSFSAKGKSIHYIRKRGTSDMNTLATTWHDVPMVAYGPGDSSLDHTNHEYLYFQEVKTTRTILRDAITEWFRIQGEA